MSCFKVLRLFAGQGGQGKGVVKNVVASRMRYCYLMTGGAGGEAEKRFLSFRVGV